MNLRVLNSDDAEQVRLWRNKGLGTLRTPRLLTAEMQADFYRDVICNGQSPHRYWAVCEDGLVGMAGLTYIQWENRIAEISLIINPRHRHKGAGEKAVDLVLAEGFKRLNLQTIFGECYLCNPAVGFWRMIAHKYKGFMTTLPRRKYWDGVYYDSLYFSIDKLGFGKSHGAV